MPAPYTGGCQCGAVRYTLEGRLGGLAVCHCRDCQRQSGSAFGMSLAVENECFRLTQGELRSFEVRCDSGRIKTCSFCPSCGTRIHHSTGERISLKAGTLDDTSWLDPDAHYWTKYKQPWVELPSDLPCIEDDG